MGKRRHIKKLSEKSEDSGDEEKEKREEVLIRRSLRSKNVPSSVSSTKKEILLVDAYDADSEPDSKQEESNFFVLKNNIVSCKEKVQKLNIKLTSIKKKCVYTNIKDCNVSIEDISTDVNSKIKTRLIGNTKIISSEQNDQKSTSANNITVEKEKSFLKHNIIKEKENVTPPELHSTPVAFNKAVRNLDDSLFGFNDIEKKLDYSSFATNDTVLSSKSTISCTKKTSSFTKTRSSINKRKYETKEALAFNDASIDVPKKRLKRKKNSNPSKTEDQDKETWERLRLQFEEVEMHELVIE